MREDVYVRGWERTSKQKQAGEEPKAQSQKPREECLGASGSQVLLKHMGKDTGSWRIAEVRDQSHAFKLQTSTCRLARSSPQFGIELQIRRHGAADASCRPHTPVFPRPSLKSVLFLSPPGEQRGRLEPNSCDNGFHSGQGASFEDC